MPSFRRPLPIVLAAVLVALILYTPGMASPPFVQGELLVKYKTSVNARTRSLVQQAAGVRSSHAIEGSQIQRITLEHDTSVEQALEIYSRDSAVEFAEPNYIVTAQMAPDDSHYGRLWGLNNIGQVVSGYAGTPGADIQAEAAWDITAGDGSVVVAVVDTGSDLNHPDFQSNVWTNTGEISGNGIDDDGNGFIDDVYGWDFMDNDPVPQDASGHGTHVAGIIAATGNNSNGVIGTAWGAQVMSLRFMDAFSQGTTSDAIRAINYALSQGARIINCSWGGTGYSASLYNTMVNADALFICAAGNSGASVDSSPFYPASFNAANVISVAASDQMDRLSWFSNHSTTGVDVAAPGIRIYSLDLGQSTIWSETFDGADLASMPGWSTGGDGNTWELGGPPGYASMTTLALNPDGDYQNDANAWVQAPVLDLSDASGTVLTFRIIGSSETNADRLTLEVSTNGTTWTSRPVKIGSTIRNSGISGTLAYFATATVDLGPWDTSAQLYLRFRFQSDSDTTGDGFYIDNLAINLSSQQDTYRYMQGTSMAAGYVSGIAALVHAANDSLSMLEIRGVIEDSVDAIGDLSGYVKTGGRVNAYRALALQDGYSLPEGALEQVNSSGGGGGGGGGGCFIGSSLMFP